MNIKFPDWFDNLTEIECEAKGFISTIEIMIDRRVEIYTIYDSIRFDQDIFEELSAEGYFYLEKLLIVRKVNKENIVNALIKINRIKN